MKLNKSKKIKQKSQELFDREKKKMNYLLQKTARYNNHIALVYDGKMMRRKGENFTTALRQP